jgi:hypothetical protein
LIWQGHRWPELTEYTLRQMLAFKAAAEARLEKMYAAPER